MTDPDVHVDDVWQSGFGRTAKVESIRAVVAPVHAMVSARLKTGAELVCEIGNFVKHRTLIERDGRPVSQEKP